jgi:putative sterol carrier protein
MSTFKNADEVYDYIGKMFETAVTDPTFIEATKDSELVIKLTQTDPAATILIDFPGQKVTCGEAALGVPATVDLRMSSDDSHKFWLGKLNFTLALAQRKVKMEGSRTKAQAAAAHQTPLRHV